ncbi:MAG: UDP-3-O-(3-hydroxymyristoyl)glucosamine N-acyltransferase [Pirellulales bacterium]|nr:UDP-3-O-(3-hydroxymyristoyl)glucosamine N-acyltransferase [Pirellulales bacterium]
MALHLSELAALVGGSVLGEADPIIAGARVLCEAQPGDITLIDHIDKTPRLAECRAAAAIVPANVTSAALPAIAVADVHAAFGTLVSAFRPSRTAGRHGVHPLAHVSPWARVADGAEIGPGATIDDDVEIGAGTIIHPGVRVLAGCRIGSHTVIYPNVVLYEDTHVGDRVIIHAGVVIGAFGFGYRQAAGRHQLTAQLGHVRIENEVEIGANSTIDRGSYGATVIGEGTKIDNQVQVGHNCQIGKHNLLCAQVGIAGSTSTGDYVVMAGQVGVRDHVHIGAGAVLGAMAGVINDVQAGTRMIGIPATPEREQKLKLAALAKLPEMRKDLKALTAKVAQLEASAASAPRDEPRVRGEAA